MNGKKEIEIAINDLINSGFADVQPKHLFAKKIVATDIWKYYKHRFGEKTVEDVEERVTNNLLYEYDVITKNPEKGNFILTMTRLGLNPVIEKPSYIPRHPHKARVLDEWGKDVEWTRKLYITKYIGVTLEPHQSIDDGVEHIANILADLSFKDYIKGNRNPLSYIDLYDGKKVIVSYLLFDDEGIKYLENNKIDFQEGGIPPMLP